MWGFLVLNPLKEFFKWKMGVSTGCGDMQTGSRSEPGLKPLCDVGHVTTTCASTSLPVKWDDNSAYLKGFCNV